MAIFGVRFFRADLDLDFQDSRIPTIFKLNYSTSTYCEVYRNGSSWRVGQGSVMFKVPESESSSELVMVRMGCSSCICIWLQQSQVGLQASANLLEFLFSGVSKVPHMQASENILIDGIQTKTTEP